MTDVASLAWVLLGEADAVLVVNPNWLPVAGFTPTRGLPLSALLTALSPAPGELAAAVSQRALLARGQCRLHSGAAVGWTLVAVGGNHRTAGQRLLVIDPSPGPADGPAGPLNVPSLHALQGLAFDRLGAGVTLNDPSDTVLMATPRACKLLGLSEDQLYGRSSADPLWQALDPDGRRLTAADHPSQQAQRTGQPVRGFIMQVGRGDGDRIWLSIDAEPIPSAQGTPPLGTVVTFMDVTTQVQLADRLADEHASLREAQAIGRVGDWRWDADGGLHHFSAEARRLLGLPAAPAPLPAAEALWPLLSSAAQASLRAQLAELMAGPPGATIAFESELALPDGEARALVNHVRRGEGTVLHGTLQDVTDLKRLESQLRQRESLLEAAVDGAQLGTWDWDVPNDRLRCNGRMGAMLGLTASAVCARPREIFLRLHPDDRAAARAHVDQALRGGLDHPSLTYRLRHEAGHWVTVLGQGTVTERGPDGVARRIVGVHVDLTAHARQAAALARYELIVSATSEAVAITDPRGVVLEVNQAFSQITGYTAAEIVGQGMNVLSSGRHAPAFYRALWARLRDTGRWSGEIINRRRDGTLLHEWLQIDTLRDRHGEPTHHVAVFSDITRIKESEARLAHLAHHDGLTGAANRLLLTAHLTHAVSRAPHTGGGALICLDIDGFKDINDHYGHDVGDAVLVALTAAIQAEIGSDELLARLGGDEFVLIADGLTRGPALVQRLDRLIQTVRRPISPAPGVELSLSVCLGVALFPDDADDPTTLMSHADAAMFRAKQVGPNSVRFHDADHSAQMHARFIAANALRAALAAGQIEAWYQPQVRLSDHAVVGFEALARWRHPTDGVIVAGQFMDLATETHQDVELDLQITDAVIEDLARWASEGLTLPAVAINITPRDVLSAAYIALLRTAPARGVPMHRLMLELTETKVAVDQPAFHRALAALRSEGVQVSIDDFGTGYSSMLRLKRLAPEQIKIDRSFVQGLPDDAEDRAIVAASLSLAHILGLESVAEGIETEIQEQTVREMGAQAGQGWRYGKAMDPADLPAWWARHGARWRPAAS